eukprot:11446336-Alexandrium_andersonii.AAC.1
MAARAVRLCPTRGSRSRHSGPTQARPSLLHLTPRRRNSSGAELNRRAGFRTGPPSLRAAPDGARIPNHAPDRAGRPWLGQQPRRCGLLPRARRSWALAQEAS